MLFARPCRRRWAAGSPSTNASSANRLPRPAWNVVPNSDGGGAFPAPTMIFPTQGGSMSVLIKGGRVVTAEEEKVADVFVEDETVSQIGESLDVQADRVIDASGKYVLPGGVDPHTHLDMPFGGTVTIDDVESGQTAAAFGGTTTHVDFIIQPQGFSFAEAFDEWRSKANGRQVIDMGYHMAVTDLREGGTLEELATLPDQGITSYKLFMAYKGAIMVDDETLFRVMQVAADTGALVMVHAEHGDAIDVLVKQALAEGKTEPKYHALTRPPETEAEATNRAIQLARVAGCRLYVVHVSCKEAVEPIAIARDKGWDVWGETCTHTSSSTTRFSSVPTSKERSTSTHRRRVRRRTRMFSGARSRPTSSRSSPPTTARSSGTARRRSGRTTSRRSRTAGPASRTGCR